LPLEFHNPALEKEFLREFLRISPDRKIPAIVEGDHVLIGFDGA
jgi:glutathione S-transferase